MGFQVPKLNYEAHLIKGHCINFDHQGFFNVHLNLSTDVFHGIFHQSECSCHGWESKFCPQAEQCNTIHAKPVSNAGMIQTSLL